MRKTLLLLSPVFMLMALSGCGKDDKSAPATSADYSHLTVGTNWSYTYTQNTNPAISYKITVSSKDTLANGKTYKVLNSTTGENRYMAKIGDNYYRFASFPTLGVNGIEELYLKGNESVNASWKDTADFIYSGLPLSAYLTYTLKEKGITRSVSGKSYSNVAHVRLDIALTLIGAIGGGDFYYAEGIGLIEDNLAIAGFGLPSYNSTQLITAYELK